MHGSQGMAWPAAIAAAAALALVPVAVAWGGAAAGRDLARDDGEVLARLPGKAAATDAHRLAYVGPDGVLQVRDVWSGTSTPVATPGLQVEEVRLAASHLAFLASAGDGGLLRLWAGPVQGPHEAVRPEAGQLSPALGRDGALAWLDLADEQADLWWRAPGGRARALTADAAGQSEPAVAPGWVAWADTRNTSPLGLGMAAMATSGETRMHPSNLDIYVLDAATGLALQLTDEPLEQMRPTFAGGRVVYLSQEGGRYGAFHREPAQGVRQPRVALGEPDWRPFLLDGDGGRVVVLDGTQGSATLRVLDVASGASLGQVSGIANALRLEASQGIAVVESVAPAGSRELVLVRLPSPLTVRVAAIGHEDGGADCWRVTAAGATGRLRVLHDAGDGAGPTEVEVVGGAARVCGGGTVRLVDEAGASAAVPLRPTQGQGAPAAPGSALLAGLAAAVAYRRRR